MSKFITNKIKTIVAAGTSLAANVESDKVRLDNYQTAKVVITTDEGTEATTTAKIVAILPDASEKEIFSKEITS